MLLNASPPIALSQPHDKVFKRLLSFISVAKDMMRQYLPDDLVSEINWSSVKLMSSEFIDYQLQKRVADVVYYARLRNNKGDIYCLFEHQSTADPNMMQRIIQYTSHIMERHSKQNPGKLPLVVPILIYHGKKTPYPYSTDLACYLPDTAASSRFRFALVRLVDLTVMSDDFLLQQGVGALLQLLLKHIRLKNFLPIFEKKIMAHAKKLRVDGKDDILKSFFECVFLTTKLSDRQYFIDLVRQDSTTKTGGDAMTPAEFLHELGMKEGLQKGLQKGLQQGLQQGLQKGFQKARCALVLSLIKEKLDVSVIMRVASVSAAEVEKIKESAQDASLE